MDCRGLLHMHHEPLTTPERYGVGMAHTVASIGNVPSCYYCGLLRIIDYHRLSWIIVDYLWLSFIIMDYGPCWIIKDYNGLWTIMDYRGLLWVDYVSWIIVDYRGL